MADPAVKPYDYYTPAATKRRLRKKKNRFGATETVSSAVAQRSGARLAAVGGKVKGVDGTDGYTGRESRLIKRARRRQKSRRTPTVM